MKLVWSPETASKAYIDTVKSCKNFTESSVAELLSAMAAGWNAKLIVESWSRGSPTATSVGLAVAAGHSGGRHVCIVRDERSRSEYLKALQDIACDGRSTQVIVGEPEEVMPGLAGVDFLVVDSKRGDICRLLRLASLGNKGAILVCKNASQRAVPGFRWQAVLGKGTRVVRSVYLPVGKGLDLAHIGSNGGVAIVGIKKRPSRWFRHIDQRSGEEHVFRG